MKKIMIIAGYGNSLVWFRSDLIKSWLNKGYQVVAAAPGHEAAEKMKEIGVKYYSIPLSRTNLNPFKDLFLIFSLRSLLKKEKPDYMFSYTIKPVIYGSLAAFFKKRVKIYSMITGLGNAFTDRAGKNKLLKFLVVWLYRIALHRNNKIFFQNTDDIDIFVRLKIVRAEKVVLVNGSGVNIDFFSPASLPEGSVRFLLIARLLWEKGIKEYVEAAQVIRRKYAQVKFAMIVWEYDKTSAAIGHKQVELWESEGIVDIFGQTGDVRPFFAGASVYVLPSYYREGIPRTILEAMAMGRPVITTDAPGCRETVVDGVNGFLVPAKDSNKLAEAMEKFILEPALIAKMGSAGRKIAAEKYDVHKVNRVINKEMELL